MGLTRLRSVTVGGGTSERPSPPERGLGFLDGRAPGPVGPGTWRTAPHDHLEAVSCGGAEGARGPRPRQGHHAPGVLRT